MGNCHSNQSTYYHIRKCFGNNVYIDWWPIFGQRCGSIGQAKKQYTKELMDGGKYQLVELIVKDNVIQYEKVIEQN